MEKQSRIDPTIRQQSSLCLAVSGTLRRPQADIVGFHRAAVPRCQRLSSPSMVTQAHLGIVPSFRCQRHSRVLHCKIAYASASRSSHPSSPLDEPISSCDLCPRGFHEESANAFNGRCRSQRKKSWTTERDSPVTGRKLPDQCDVDWRSFHLGQKAQERRPTWETAVLRQALLAEVKMYPLVSNRAIPWSIVAVQAHLQVRKASSSDVVALEIRFVANSAMWMKSSVVQSLGTLRWGLSTDGCA